MDRGIRIVLYLRPDQVAWLKASQALAGYRYTAEYARALFERVISEEHAKERRRAARNPAPPDSSQARQDQG
jgi:hypothetical protein